MKLKYIFTAFASASLVMTACNDYLDKEPESAITPASYFQTEDDLSAYMIDLYSFLNSTQPGTYGIGVFEDDNATDNQAYIDYSSRWVPGEWRVPQSTDDSDRTEAWNFYQIRDCNYFLDQVLPKYESGSITGSEDNVKHYIGEAYFLRAYAYFDKLQTIGDCPIIETALTNDKEILIAASKRQPRNKVARFILEDLDKAIELLSETSPAGKNRINRDCAYLLRSRVALFEGTWEKYHKGTAFVPGGSGWPGNTEDLSDGYNIDTEINYFLQEAMTSAKVLGDKLYGNLVNNTDTKEGMDENLNSINPYYTMFCDEDMEDYSEVLMWRQFDKSLSVTHNIQLRLMRNGGGTGMTRGLVNAFLMRNGLPIYASGSGYDTAWEEQNVTAVLQDRDSRIQIFTKQDDGVEYYIDGSPVTVDFTWVVMGDASTRMTTGFAIKKGKHYDGSMANDHYVGTTGSIVFRGTEALLNYMEACYELNGSIDGTAGNYWKALRTRAKVDPDYTKTINATDVSKEAEGDFGAYSHGQLIDATLYNIRRERRCELVCEGFRWMDLKRWRACDQVDGYQVEGMRYWGSSYEGNWKDKDGKDEVVVDVAGGTGNMSSKDVSVYIRPYQISSVNNSVYNGYKFTAAHYLSPLPQSAFRLTASGDQTDLSTSTVYQNPGWPMVAGQGPTE